MRKNDGYALPLVLVVMTILCLIAVTVMTFSLDNLKSQQSSVAYMQAKYEAQGKLERLEGKLLKLTATEVEELTNSEDLSELKDLCSDSGTNAPGNWQKNSDEEGWTFTVSANGSKSEEEEVQVACTILLKQDAGGKFQVEYQAYTVTTQPKGGQDG